MAPTPPVVASPPAAPPAPPPTCLKSERSFFESHLEGDTLKLCSLEDEVVDCWTFSLATNTWTPLDRHPYAASQTAAAVTVAGSTITACKPDRTDCRSIPFSPAPKADESTDATANADLSLVALLVESAPIRVLDATGKQLAEIKGWPTGMSEPKTPAFFRQARFVGPVLAAYIADTPMTSAIRLFDPRTGKKVGDVDAGKPMSDTVDPVAVVADQFAFVEFDSSAIVIQNVKTGKLVKKYKITGVEPGGYSMLVLAPDGKSLVAAQGAQIVRLDLAKGSVARFSAPRCPS